MAWLSRRTTAEWHRHKPQTSTDSEHFWTQELERVMQAVGRQHPVSIHIVDIWNSYPPGVPKLPKKVFLCLGFEGNLNWEKNFSQCKGPKLWMTWIVADLVLKDSLMAGPFGTSTRSEGFSQAGHFLRTDLPFLQGRTSTVYGRWIHAEALILLGRLQEAVEVWDGKVISSYIWLYHLIYCYIDSCWTWAFCLKHFCLLCDIHLRILDSQQRSQHWQVVSQYLILFHGTIISCL